MTLKTLNKDKILKYSQQEFKTEPDYPWAKSPNNAVLRHPENKKWYALVMTVKRSKIGLTGNENIDILNIKCDPLMIDSLLTSDGFIPAYHMNKSHWITILLNGSVPDNDILNLLRISFQMTK